MKTVHLEFDPNIFKTHKQINEFAGLTILNFILSVLAVSAGITNPMFFALPVTYVFGAFLISNGKITEGDNDGNHREILPQEFLQKIQSYFK